MENELKSGGKTRVSIAPLKQLAEKTLKPDPVLRKLILAEPDGLPPHLIAGKVSIYVKLLEKELGSELIMSS